MPSVMTLDGARVLGGNVVGDFILRQPLVIMVPMTLAVSFGIGALFSYPVVWGVQHFKGGRKALRGLYGARGTARRPRRRRRR